MSFYVISKKIEFLDYYLLKAETLEEDEHILNRLETVKDEFEKEIQSLRKRIELHKEKFQAKEKTKEG